MKKIPKIVLIVVFALVFYFAGYFVGHKNLVFEKNFKPKIANTELFKPRNVNFGLFWETWNKIMDEYIGSPDTQKMVYGAISGMVKSLDDPYSVFMEPKDTKSFLEELSGEISGIGAEIDFKDKKLLIVAPIAGSPAEKAGLKPQDQVLKINDESTENLSLEEAISKIRGKAGTKVKLEINREGFTEPQIFEIERAVIRIESVKWEMKDNIAYIEISQFGDDTVTLMKKVSREIVAKNPKGIVLDLRSNPGGYLDGAIDVSSLFLQDSVVVKEKDKQGQVKENRTTLDPILKDYPLVVLIDGGSASASEIVAGALQDNNRAKIVGTTSFGKGSVQNLEELSDGSTLRITTAKWLTPKDRAIDKVGIEPDIKVELTAEDVANKNDLQLQKALELLK